jgi:ribosomal protein L28
VVALVESNPGSVNVVESVTTLVVHRGNSYGKAEESSNRGWKINIIMKAIYDLVMNT